MQTGNVTLPAVPVVIAPDWLPTVTESRVMASVNVFCACDLLPTAVR